MKSNLFIPLLTALIVAIPCSIVDAAEWDGCKRWLAGGVTLRANFAQFTGANGTPFFNALNEANDAWRATATNFKYTITLDSNSSTTLGNGVSEISFTNSLPEEANAGVIRLHFWSCFYKEADVLINVNKPLVVSTAKSGLGAYGNTSSSTNPRSFQAVIIHELGHVQGLNHEGDEYNIMGDSGTHLHTNGNVARAYVGEDAAQMSTALYGQKSVPSPFGMRDFGLSHWKHAASVPSLDGVGFKSAHTRTEITCDGKALNQTIVNGEPRYTVPVGVPLDYEITVESMGEFTDANEQVTIKFFISTNDFISTFDTLIGQTSVQPGLTGDVSTMTFPVTLPFGTPVGQPRWIGAIINPDKINTEVDTTNNTTYIAVIR